MEKIKQMVEVELDVTPAKLAEMFWSMDSDEQATFFNTVGYFASESTSTALDRQMIQVAQSYLLTPAGRRVLRSYF